MIMHDGHHFRESCLHACVSTHAKGLTAGACLCNQGACVPAPQVCEKEMKTKAFSKEGLGQAAKLDPRDKARNEMRDWISDTVVKLGAEVGRF